MEISFYQFPTICTIILREPFPEGERYGDTFAELEPRSFPKTILTASLSSSTYTLNKVLTLETLASKNFVNTRCGSLFKISRSQNSALLFAPTNNVSKHGSRSIENYFQESKDKPFNNVANEVLWWSAHWGNTMLKYLYVEFNTKL